MIKKLILKIIFRFQIFRKLILRFPILNKEWRDKINRTKKDIRYKDVRYFSKNELIYFFINFIDLYEWQREQLGLLTVISSVDRLERIRSCPRLSDMQVNNYQVSDMLWCKVDCDKDCIMKDRKKTDDMNNVERIMKLYLENY